MTVFHFMGNLKNILAGLFNYNRTGFIFHHLLQSFVINLKCFDLLLASVSKLYFCMVSLPQKDENRNKQRDVSVSSSITKKKFEDSFNVLKKQFTKLLII